MKKIALVVGMVMAMAAGQAMAQSYRSEVSAFGNYTRMKQQGQTSSVSILDLSYGYYFTPQLVGLVNLQRFSSDSAGFTDFGLGAKYYFGQGRRGSFVPFVDATFGVEKAAGGGSSHHDRRYMGGFGGAYFVTEATSFDVGLHWFRVSTEPFSTSGTIMGMGFTTRF